MNKRAWKSLAAWVGGFVGGGFAAGLLSGNPSSAVILAMLGVSFGLLAAVVDNHFNNPYNPDE